MTTQTDVTAGLLAGRPGQLFDQDPNNELGTLIATSAVPFGALVSEQAEGEGTVPDATGEVTGARVGIAIIDHTKASQVGYQIGEAMTVLFRGKAFVLNEIALAFGDTPFVRFAAAGAEELGAWRNDADTADAVAVPGARVHRAGAANAAVVELHPAA